MHFRKVGKGLVGQQQNRRKDRESWNCPGSLPTMASKAMNGKKTCEQSGTAVGKGAWLTGLLRLLAWSQHEKQLFYVVLLLRV